MKSCHESVTPYRNKMYSGNTDGQRKLKNMKHLDKSNQRNHNYQREPSFFEKFQGKVQKVKRNMRNVFTPP